MRLLVSFGRGPDTLNESSVKKTKPENSFGFTIYFYMMSLFPASNVRNKKIGISIRIIILNR